MTVMKTGDRVKQIEAAMEREKNKVQEQKLEKKLTELKQIVQIEAAITREDNPAKKQKLEKKLADLKARESLPDVIKDKVRRGSRD